MRLKVSCHWIAITTDMFEATSIYHPGRHTQGVAIHLSHGYADTCTQTQCLHCTCWLTLGSEGKDENICVHKRRTSHTSRSSSQHQVLTFSTRLQKTKATVVLEMLHSATTRTRFHSHVFIHKDTFSYTCLNTLINMLSHRKLLSPRIQNEETAQ